VPKHYRLIDFRLAEPGALFATREDLYRHVLSAPTSTPDFAEAPLSNDMTQLHLAGNRTLHQQGQTS